MPKEPIDTIEKLAVATQQEFNDVRVEMRGEFETVRGQMRTGFASVTETLNSVLLEIRQIRIAELEKRVALLERHVWLVK